MVVLFLLAQNSWNAKSPISINLNINTQMSPDIASGLIFSASCKALLYFLHDYRALKTTCKSCDRAIIAITPTTFSHKLWGPKTNHSMSSRISPAKIAYFITHLIFTFNGV
jgi:hypothetical protein